MSRHRNIRNMDYDDYYDDYDDDYYDDYDDDYAAPTKKTTKKTATTTPASSKKSTPAKKQTNKATTTPSKKTTGGGGGGISVAAKPSNSKIGGGGISVAKPLIGKSGGKVGGGDAGATKSGGISVVKPTNDKKQPIGKNSNVSSEEQRRRLRVLTSMGFGAIESTEALEKCGGDASKAVEMLLSQQKSSGTTTTTTTTSDDATDAAAAAAAASSGSSKATGDATTTTSSSSPGEKKSAVVVPNKKKEKDELLKKLLKKERSRLSMVVLGHVDAGKSTLMGQVLLQVGYVDKRIVTKYQKQAAELGKASFALAWVMDEDESERERGVTMDVATKFISLKSHDLTILDAPGHADFIPAMITGAASADVGLLVVAATPGEYESGFSDSNFHTGQTREHIVLSRGLGVSQLIVAVNKLDASDPPWSQERFEYIKTTLMNYLQQNGFQPKRVRFVPVSALSGANVKTKPQDAIKWYNGPTLLEAIDTFLPAQRNIEKPLRVIVTDVYQEGKNVTTRGRVAQGFLRVGEKVAVLPIGDEAQVSRIDHTYSSTSSQLDSHSIDRQKLAMAGDNLEVILSNIDVMRVTPGCILSHVDSRVPIKRKIQAKVLVMEKLTVPIIKGAQVLFHMHSIDVPAVIYNFISTTKRDGTVNPGKPRVLTGGISATVEIKLQEKLCVEEFTECRALGRFVLRRGGMTVAVGVIEKLIT